MLSPRSQQQYLPAIWAQAYGCERNEKKIPVLDLLHLRCQDLSLLFLQMHLKPLWQLLAKIKGKTYCLSLEVWPCTSTPMTEQQVLAVQWHWRLKEIKQNLILIFINLWIIASGSGYTQKWQGIPRAWGEMHALMYFWKTGRDQSVVLMLMH